VNRTLAIDSPVQFLSNDGPFLCWTPSTVVVGDSVPVANVLVLAIKVSLKSFDECRLE
jgi:hypothetical protein